MPHDKTTGIYYEIHGNGYPLFLGFPVMASHGEIFGNGSVLTGFLERLTDRYRVLVIDYPSIGKSASIPPAELTAARTSEDMLAVADAAGFDRFAWWGGTFGAMIGLQLASQSDRPSALICAGWPPLGAPYADMLRGVRLNAADPPAHARQILREPSQYAQWVPFYESLQRWPEAQAVARIQCPQMAVFGSDAESDVAGIPLHIAATLRERRLELEALGWRVTEIPGRDTGLILDPESLVPAVREFLDAVT